MGQSWKHISSSSLCVKTKRKYSRYEFNHLTVCSGHRFWSLMCKAIFYTKKKLIQICTLLLLSWMQHVWWWIVFSNMFCDMNCVYFPPFNLALNPNTSQLLIHTLQNTLMKFYTSCQINRCKSIFTHMADIVLSGYML